MNDRYISSRNAEGYSDPTARDALRTVQREMDAADWRHKRLISALLTLIDFSGYDLLVRIEVRDRQSGRIYR